jgi:hypothetical protein
LQFKTIAIFCGLGLLLSLVAAMLYGLDFTAFWRLASSGRGRSSSLASFATTLAPFPPSLRPLRERRRRWYGCIDRHGGSRLDRLVDAGARLH